MTNKLIPISKSQIGYFKLLKIVNVYPEIVNVYLFVIGILNWKGFIYRFLFLDKNKIRSIY